MNPNHVATPLCVASGSEAYSNTMAAPHEYFDLTGVRRWVARRTLGETYVKAISITCAWKSKSSGHAGVLRWGEGQRRQLKLVKQRSDPRIGLRQTRREQSPDVELSAATRTKNALRVEVRRSARRWPGRKDALDGFFRNFSTVSEV